MLLFFIRLSKLFRDITKLKNEKKGGEDA